MDLHLHHRVAQAGANPIQTLAQLTSGGLALLPQAAEGIGLLAVKGCHHLARPALTGPLHHRQTHGQDVLHQGEPESIKGVGGHGGVPGSGTTV